VPDRDSARRHGVRALDVRDERQLPIGRRARRGARGDRAGREDRSAARVLRAGAPRPLGAGAHAEPEELKATAILALSLDEASAKISTGGPDDGESEDAALDVWAGHVPIRLVAGEPIPCPHLRPGIPLPADIAEYQRRLDRAA
jgi:hypothetical protein